jgi:hypothetical protein
MQKILIQVRITLMKCRHNSSQTGMSYFPQRDIIPKKRVRSSQSILGGAEEALQLIGSIGISDDYYPGQFFEAT